MAKSKHSDAIVRFGTSFPRQVVVEMDKVRGDTNRSLWLQRLARKELQWLKMIEQQQEPQEREQQGKLVEAFASGVANDKSWR